MVVCFNRFNITHKLPYFSSVHQYTTNSSQTLHMEETTVAASRGGTPVARGGGNQRSSKIQPLDIPTHSSSSTKEEDTIVVVVPQRGIEHQNVSETNTNVEHALNVSSEQLLSANSSSGGKGERRRGENGEDEIEEDETSLRSPRSPKAYAQSSVKVGIEFCQKRESRFVLDEDLHFAFVRSNCAGVRPRGGKEYISRTDLLFLGVGDRSFSRTSWVRDGRSRRAYE